MPEPSVTVVIPTLAREGQWLECLRSMEAQSWRAFQVWVVDNGAAGAVRAGLPPGSPARVIEPERNLGFGEAVNEAWRRSPAEFLAVINDDAEAEPQWLEMLVREMIQHPEVGLCASCVLLETGSNGPPLLDSAGMLLCRDGSSKQRGHLQPPGGFPAGEALFPSGSAALFRGAMIEEIGGFDPSYFLYCEDTDLGLRAAWAGWRCRYVPGAVVRHKYSQSAGRASPLKAYLVERNRLATIVKNFPLSLLLAAPFLSVARYFWHLWFLAAGKGKAAEFVAGGGPGWRLPWFVVKAHIAVLFSVARLWRERRQTRRRAKIAPAEFRALIRRHSISAREVAAL